ncbi:adenine deaminase C-terminal domain-containing protein [Alkalihalobacillus pseudalcaliphilus]|uniref:adenine deaminase C-terminal domain-containing protein n=1 Tax=Alkalihalobacillus pseudalcaliphilus TaxID=79884 RepID=UPI00064DA043|nr:adenine deaminase C-terminal domain-containing protein [Alkalihalobacillus pseudalcaliphilus]KMK75307.1 adenine deaminase [Alkalihalobacillus pseudalcaliphilus]
MAERINRSTKKKLRHQLAVVKGEKAPSLVLKNATYLNQARQAWLKANIWILEDTIVYVGEKMPTLLNDTEIVDCTNQFIVPGYIEHHVHPYQLYNPLSFAKYASQTGTTTLVSDNLIFLLSLEKKKALSLISELDTAPTSMYWWSRYDAQTELSSEDVISNSKMKEWLEHHLVVQGGELTSWPKVLNGDDSILHWIQETQRLRKPIEGHFPGASEKTLTQMALVGVTADHESMSGKDALMRINMGYYTSLRHSSIRPDLEKMIQELQGLGLENFDRCFMTTDGSPPSFYEAGVMNHLIQIAIDHGVPPIEAYNMASYNVARYYNFENKHGLIAPGRMANLNFLKAEDQPTPTSVLAKGQWIVKDEQLIQADLDFPWENYGVSEVKYNWDLHEDELHFSMPMGIEMANAVILKPYHISIDSATKHLSTEHDESFCALIDRNGKWQVNTMIKGFANQVSGLASSYNNAGDVMLIGKSIPDMVCAFRQMKQQGGGIVLAEKGEIIGNIELPLLGMMSNKPMERIMEEEKHLVQLLKDRGYQHEDPIYSLLFFSSTHLPYIRLTQNGIYDVKKKAVLFPAIMR